MSCLHAPSLARRRPSRIPPRRIDRIQGEPDRPPLSLSHIHTSPPLFSSPTTSSSPAASLTPLHKVDQLVPICKRRGVSASRSVCVCMVLGRTPLCPTSIRRGGWGVGGWLTIPRGHFQPDSRYTGMTATNSGNKVIHCRLIPDRQVRICACICVSLGLWLT